MGKDVFMQPCISVSVEFLPADEGGRKGNFYLAGGYRPHFRVFGDTEYLGVQFIEDPNRIINPKEMVTARVSLVYYPDVSYSKLCVDKEFEILEGARVVGKGRVINPVSIDE